MKAHLDRGPSALVMSRESRCRHSIKENAPGRIHVPPGLGLSHFSSQVGRQIFLSEQCLSHLSHLSHLFPYVA